MTADPAPGSVFAGYLVERRIGAGGMGTVYVARHPRLPRSVALKILNVAPDDASHMRARFEREADLVAQLDHPNIVEIYDRGTEGHLLWITMRLVDGSDVARMVGPGRPIRPVERAVGMVAQAAAGLDAAHRRGLLHRDVKPANLLVATADDGSDQVFVTDFGIARSVGAPRLTSTGSIVATLAYASPEQIGAGDLDHRTDVYSLGATLYEMFTGEAPFAGRPALAVLNAHLNEPAPLPSRVDPTLPRGLDDVIATAMAKDPGRRYDSCGDLAAAARQALGAGGRPTPAWNPPVSNPPVSKPPATTRAAPTPAVPRGVVEAHPAQSAPGPQPPGAPTASTAPTASASPPPGVRRSNRGALIALGVTAVVLVGVIVGLLAYGGPRSEVTEARETSGPAGATSTSGAPGSSAPPGPNLDTTGATTEQGTSGPETTTGPAATAAAAFPAWGPAGELVALFPDLLPHSPDGVGYQGARCESIDVLNNGRMPALECVGDEGLQWYVWSFRPGDPRRDDIFETNYDNESTLEQAWQRPSGSGTVRTTDGPSTSGVLTVSFDDSQRRWVVIDLGSWYYNGRGLFDRWWAQAPV